MTSESSAPSRRNFFTGAIYGLWALIAAALGIPAGAYLLLPPRPSKEQQWVEAGDLERMLLKSPEEVVFRRIRRDGWKIISEKTTAWVVRLPDGGIVAYAPQCTHLGCAYHWDERNRNFLCPCHTTTFSIDGKVLSGPATRPLDRYEVRIEGSRLLLGPIRKLG